MGSTRPQTVGGTVAVSDSAALALLDAAGFPPGTRVYNADVGHMFVLTTSVAALDPDVVVEVLGTVGARWILDTSDSDVQSVTGGDGISVDNSDPHNPVVELAAGDGSLASIYAYGIATVDPPTGATANTLAGAEFDVSFDEDGAIESSETGSGDVNLTLRKHSTLTPGVTLMSARYITKMDFVGGVNTSGGVSWEYAIENAAGTANTYATGNANLLELATPSNWYVPALSAAGSPELSYMRWFLENRRGSGNTSQVYFNSDGVEWREAMFPAAGGPYVLLAEQISMRATTGAGAEPEVGSTIRHTATGPATGPDDGPQIAGYDEVLTAKNFGSAQAAGRFDIRTSTLTGGSAVRASYSSTSLGMVDIVSASTDFKTATTFTVVPVATGVQLAVGTRFLPIAAYVEFTTVSALTVGPSVKLGNDGSHVNVAGVLAIANTVVTDDAVPFVMASSPAVITLTSTGIICEVTVQATATTATGKIHIIGAYV